MKSVKWEWVIWGSVLVILAALGISYASYKSSKKPKKEVSADLKAAFAANQAGLVSLSIISLPVTKKEFLESDFSSEFL